MKKLLKFSLLLAIAVNLANAKPYVIDPVHSSVSFKVKHLSISKVNGNFGKFNAVIDFDKLNNEVKAFEANIDTNSINTENESRDAHLKSADFFDVEKFDKITFKMTKYEKQSDKEGKIHGELTMHGVTKNVVFDFEVGGFAKDDKGEKMGFSIDTDINRKDFGIGVDTSDLSISDKVNIEVEAEANMK